MVYCLIFDEIILQRWSDSIAITCNISIDVALVQTSRIRDAEPKCLDACRLVSPFEGCVHRLESYLHHDKRRDDTNCYPDEEIILKVNLGEQSPYFYNFKFTLAISNPLKYLLFSKYSNIILSVLVIKFI